MSMSIEQRFQAEQLALHQLRLLAASLRREIRQLQKVKEPHRHTQRLASMTESVRIVISKVRDV